MKLLLPKDDNATRVHIAILCVSRAKAVRLMPSDA